MVTGQVIPLIIDTASQFEPDLTGGYAHLDTKAVLKCPGVITKVIVTCLKSGQRTAITEYCLPKEKSIHFMLIVASLCMTVVIVILITVVYICVTKPVPIASSPSPSQAGSSTSGLEYNPYDQPDDDYLQILPDVPIR